MRISAAPSPVEAPFWAAAATTMTRDALIDR
eukprot:SAG11_NODE_43811_length_161_cov_64.306452_1_plen_30_part_01